MLGLTGPMADSGLLPEDYPTNRLAGGPQRLDAPRDRRSDTMETCPRSVAAQIPRIKSDTTLKRRASWGISNRGKGPTEVIKGARTWEQTPLLV